MLRTCGSECVCVKGVEQDRRLGCVRVFVYVCSLSNTPVYVAIGWCQYNDNWAAVRNGATPGICRW